MNAPIKLASDRLEAALKLARAEHDLWIGGKPVASTGGERIERLSPGHGVLVSRVPSGTAIDADRAIAAARAAFDHGPWPHATAAERAKVLLKTADLIERDLELIATMDTLESGKPIAQARAEIAGAADIWRYAATLARVLHGESYSNLGSDRLGFVLREPIGVVSIITPWNFPFLIVGQKLPFALAAGCTAVVKPSEMTSSSTLHLAKLLAEAGLPEGACNVVTGYGPAVGAPMTTDARVDMVSFTGSTAVGKRAMAAAADTLKKVSMELGGKNPQIVFPDADLDAAVDAVLFGAFFNAGECCNAGSRLLVHRDIASPFAAEVASKVKNVPVGDPLDPATKVGALISVDHLTKVMSAVGGARAAGAEIVTGGDRLDGEGLFLAPTVVDRVEASMGIARDEVFGPVLSVIAFNDAADAVRIANSTHYGLSAGVWSRDFDTVMAVGRGVRAGTVWANTFMDGTPELPFGGYHQSGLGRELGRRAVEDYTEEKTFHVHTGPRTGWWIGPRGTPRG